MTIDEIFSNLISHMVEGLMTHAQLSDYYGFLGLKGYQKCHKYHYFIENKNYRDLSAYCIEHYNKIPKEIPVGNPNIIPDSWYQYERQDVNASTKMNGVQVGVDKWIEWERKTKALYERMYLDAVSLNDIGLAKKLMEYIEDVNDELKEAYQKKIELKSIDYNISDILQEQEYICKKYKKKLKEIEL